MKKPTLFTALILVLCFVAAHGQTDSIYSRSEVIACTVKEVGEQTVSYTFPGEDVLNSMYKNTIAKIVFRNGRVQTFEEFKALQPVLHAGDFAKVQILTSEAETKGLAKIEPVISKAKGATTLASALAVQDRALRKLLIETAMVGGNALSLSQASTTPARAGNEFIPGQTAYSLQTGMAFTSQSPEEDAFRKMIGDKNTFEVQHRYWMGRNSFDLSSSAASGTFTLRLIEPSKNNKLWVRGTFSKFRTASGEGIPLDGVFLFRVVAYDDEQFTLFFQSNSGFKHNIVVKIKD
ncbi:MAG TPA: hypothetical protein PLL53_21070 [Saprospiraceae bacterium]|nr:hypothetical protein [Saprospiraceae bacterium]